MSRVKCYFGHYHHKSRKSQITIFIILAIIILFAVAILLYVTKIIKTPEPKTPIQNLPEQLQPIKNYVDICLEQTAENAFRIIGSNGGYINPEESGIFYIPNYPTIGNGVKLFDNTNTIPYWYYMSSSDDCDYCIMTNAVPDLYAESGKYSIEAQVNDYISSHIDDCLANFDQFKNFRITNSDSYKVITKINEEDVSVIMEHPILVEYENGKVNITYFNSVLDLRFKKLYDAARLMITNFEENNDAKLFEQYTLNLIDVYSGGYNTKIPPRAGGMSFDADYKFWIVNDVEKEFRSILAENIPIAQIMGSRGHYVYDSPNKFSNGFYSNMLNPIYGTDLEYLGDVEINFLYNPDWPLYLRINGNRGVAKSQTSTINILILSLPLTRSDFSYDVSYPVAVTMNDPYAFKSKGYTLNFAFEVNVRNNQPVKLLSEEPESNYTGRSFFGAEDQRNSGIITIKTIDTSTSLPVSDVLLNYECGSDGMEVGSTKLFDDGAYIKTKLPICLNGLISGYKDGYFIQSKFLTTSLGKDKEIIINAEPEKTLNLYVKKRAIGKETVLLGGLNNYVTTWVFYPNSSYYLDNDDELTLIFTKQKLSDSEDDYIKFVQFNGTMISSTVNLVSGQYKVEGYLIRYFGVNRSIQRFVIPPKTFNYDSEPLNPFCCDSSITTPEIEFNNSIFLGGVLFDDTTSGFVNISIADLSKKSITVYIVAATLNDLQEPEDVEQIDKGPYYSTNNRESLLPVFE